MDTSKEYIKMCEKAEEIQRSDEGLRGESDGIHYISDDVFYLGERKCIWLPHQDQLQEMVNDDNLTALLQDFISWLAKQCNLPMHMTSMEQLWLAFVMSEKYQKVWDGDEWIERKE